MGKEENKIEDLQKQMQEEQQKKQQKFADEFNALCQKFGFTISPKITLTTSGIIPDLEIIPLQK